MPREGSFPLGEENLSHLWRCTCGRKWLDPHQPEKTSLDISVHIPPAPEEFLLGFVCYCKNWVILVQFVAKKPQNLSLWAGIDIYWKFLELAGQGMGI